MDSETPPLHAVLPIRAGEEKAARRCLASLRATAQYPIALEIVYGGIEPLPEIEKEFQDIIFARIVVKQRMSKITLTNFSIFWRDLGAPLLRLDPDVEFLTHGWLLSWVETMRARVGSIAIIQLAPKGIAIEGSSEKKDLYCNWIPNLPSQVQLISPAAIDPNGMYFDAFSSEAENEVYGVVDYNLRARHCRDGGEMQIWSDLHTQYRAPELSMPANALLYYRSLCIDNALTTGRVQNELRHDLYRREMIGCA